MNCVLTRTDFLDHGIYGELHQEDGTFIAYTLEHAYQTDAGDWAPKIPPGTYTCVLGPHRLLSMTHDFDTYEITGVEGHSKLLFHDGNYNHDSDGCVLLGSAVNFMLHMITQSKVAFGKFLQLQDGVSEFLVVIK